MDPINFLTVKANLFVLAYGKQFIWIPLENNRPVSVSLCYDKVNGPRCLSMEGSRVVLDSKIMYCSEFRKNGSVFGQWSDVVPNCMYGIGFKDRVDGVQFSEIFRKMKKLLTSKQALEASHLEKLEARAKLEEEKSEPNANPNDPTPYLLPSIDLASDPTPSASREEIYEGSDSTENTRKRYLSLKPVSSSEHCLDIAKLNTEINVLKSRNRNFLKARDDMISYIQERNQEAEECLKESLKWKRLHQKCSAEVRNKYELIEHLEEKLNDERALKDHYEKLENEKSIEITALREVLNRCQGSDAEKDPEVLLGLLKPYLSTEVDEPEPTEEFALCVLEKIVDPLSQSIKDLHILYDDLLSAINGFRHQVQAKNGPSSTATNESD